MTRQIITGDFMELLKKQDDPQSSPSGTPQHVPVSAIEVRSGRNPRVAMLSEAQQEATFGQGGLQDLIASIQGRLANGEQRGILQPLLVRPHPTEPGRYELVAGERRLRAALLCGLETVPVSVREMSDTDAEAAALAENRLRKDVDTISETWAALKYAATLLGNDHSARGLTETLNELNELKYNPDRDVLNVDRQLRESFGLSLQTFMRFRKPLLALNRAEIEAVQAGRLSSKSAILISRLGDRDRQALLERVLSGEVSEGQDLEQAAERLNNRPKDLQKEIRRTLKELKSQGGHKASEAEVLTRRYLEALEALRGKA